MYPGALGAPWESGGGAQGEAAVLAMLWEPETLVAQGEAAVLAMLGEPEALVAQGEAAVLAMLGEPGLRALPSGLLVWILRNLYSLVVYAVLDGVLLVEQGQRPPPG